VVVLYTRRHIYSMDSLVDIMTRLWTLGSKNRGSFPGGRGDNYYLLPYLLSYFTYLLTLLT